MKKNHKNDFSMNLFITKLLAMKKKLKIAAIAMVLVLGSSMQNDTSAQSYYDDHGDVSYQTFYDELSPYGRWIDYPEYGYVWVPDGDRDFRPYSTNGHWVWTDDYEWMWVSDYDWGWAPFHYGRWLEDDFYGWVWVPGYEWSPAWVAWRNGGDYYGWAPLRPGIHISLNFNIGTYNPPYDYWCFVPRRYIASPRIHNYYINRGRNITIINQTTIINNYNYNHNVYRTGPRRSEVERYTGRITPVRFRTTNTPGRTQFRNNEVRVYRPTVQQDNNRQFAPRQFDRFERNAVANTNSRTNGNNNGNRVNRNDNTNPRSNNLPQRNTGVDRRYNPDRQPQRDNADNDNQNRRRFDRNNSNGQSNRTNDSRLPRTIDRQERTPTQNQDNNNRRVFERRSNNGNTNTPSRQSQTRPVERQPVQQPQQEQRRQPVQRPQMEQRRPVQQQPQRYEQPRRIERRTNDNNNGNRGSSGGRFKRG